MHSGDLFVYNLATLKEGQKLIMKRQSKINFPLNLTLASYVVKDMLQFG